MNTDPISDLLTRIRNAQTARHEFVTIPHSIIKEGIVKVLHDEGFVGAYQVVAAEGKRKVLHVALRYTGSGRKEPVISTVVRTSRPGRRYYVGYRNIRSVRNGMGIAIFSTPKGIITDHQAREQKVGGEFLCRVW